MQYKKMDKKAYYKSFAVIFLIMILSFVLMFNFGIKNEKNTSGITGFSVLENNNLEEAADDNNINNNPNNKDKQTKPIQEVVKDLQNAGFEYVANEPDLKYAD